MIIDMDIVQKRSEIPKKIAKISYVDKEKAIHFLRLWGESMNKTIPHNSLIAVKPIELSELKDEDIVVYSHNHEYGVKRFLQNENEIWFRPHSTDFRFRDDIYDLDNVDGLEIHGKVVVYIVELD